MLAVARVLWTGPAQCTASGRDMFGASLCPENGGQEYVGDATMRTCAL